MGKKGSKRDISGMKSFPNVGITGSGRRFEASAGLEVASSATNRHPHTLHFPHPKLQTFWVNLTDVDREQDFLEM